jgi:uncharacterized membrane protein
MCPKNFNPGGTKVRLLLSLLFVTLISLVGNAQEEKPNVIVDYGEHHPAVFMIAIFVVVVVAVFVVAYFFKKGAKKAEAQKENFRPAARTGKHPDRRYASKRMPQGGGFTRK